MEIIPLISLEKRKIIDTDQKTTDAKEIKLLDEDERVYILDKDGIEKDKPNLCLFQRTADKYQLWIDSQPVELGDVVDSFMAGASSITLRKNLWSKIEIEKIREITENEIFFQIDLKDSDELNKKTHILEKADGFVIFNEKELADSDSNYAAVLKKIATMKKTYAYETKPENIKYWQSRGVKGLLVDIKNYERFKNKWNLMQKS